MFSKVYSKELIKMNSFQEAAKMKKTLILKLRHNLPIDSHSIRNKHYALSKKSKINLNMKHLFCLIHPLTNKFGRSFIKISNEEN